MTTLQGLLFALWFAWTDLAGRWRSLKLSAVHWASMTALVALSLSLVGLVVGSDERQRAGFRGDPVTTSLALYPVSGAEITRADADALAEAIRGRLASPTRLRRVDPFAVVERDWARVGAGHAPRCQGRAVPPGDPLFQSYRKREHWLKGGPPTDDEPGVVITLDMLTRLGLTKAQLPDELETITGGTTTKVRVSGVLAEPLPGRFLYAIPAALAESLHEKSRVSLVSSVTTGPLPAAWVKLRRPPEALAKALEAEKLRYEAKQTVDVGVYAWALRSDRDTHPTLPQWKAMLAEAVAQAGPGPDEAELKAFVNAQPLTQEEASRPPMEGPTRVTVYVESLDDIGPALPAAERQGYRPLDDRHLQIERILKMTGKYLVLSGVVLVGLALLIGGNSLAIHSLQASQKLPEIGMLKAAGVTGWHLAVIYVLEAVLIWLFAVVPGLLAGWGLGSLAEWYIGRDDPESAVAFGVPWWLLGTVVAGALALSVVCTLLANYRVWTSTPLECLGEQ